MSVILMILKIIGITLLAILGLVLLILLLVLLVPVRYSGKVSKDETIDADANATWLLHLVHFIFSYHDGNIGKKLKILGITFKNDVTEKTSEDSEVEENGIIEEIKDESESNAEGTESKEYNKVKKEIEENKLEEGSKVKEGKIEEETTVKADTETNVEKKVTVKADTVNEAKETKETKEKQETKEDKGLKGSKVIEEKKSFAQRKTEVVEKIKNIYNKITHYRDVINDPRVKSGFGYAKKKVFEVLKHILPKKLKLDADYGFEDPSTTGYITAVLAALYGPLGNMVKARPDFENEVLRGNAELSGRVRIGTVVFKALQVILKKECRYVYKLIKAEREAE